MLRAELLAIIVLSGCFESKAPPCTVDCTSDEECPSGLACNGAKCSVGGAVCTASCVSGETRCAGSGVLEVCDAAGSNWTSTSCATACVPAGADPAHCQHVVPVVTALAHACDEPAEAATWPLPASFPTGMAAACTEIVAQVAGPEICLVRAKDIVLPASTRMKVTGDRALALVADATLTVAGEIDLSASEAPDNYGDGPGGGGARVSGLAPSGALGGSGAGFRTAGAPGGAFGTGLAGGPPNNEVLDGLLAGGFRAAGSGGGGGGGALALISCTGKTTVDALVAVAGGGGSGAPAATPTAGAGWGGGSGGTVLMQGMRVSIGGQLYANGGGGGGGSTGDVGGGRGERGSLALNAPALGGAPVIQGGQGGNGGVNSVLPGAGEGTQESSGGGGGATGYLIAATPSAADLSLDSAVLSPAVSPLSSAVR